MLKWRWGRADPTFFQKDLDRVCHIIECERYSVPLENLRCHNDPDYTIAGEDAELSISLESKIPEVQSGHCQRVQAVQSVWTDASPAADFLPRIPLSTHKYYQCYMAARTGVG